MQAQNAGLFAAPRPVSAGFFWLILLQIHLRQHIQVGWVIRIQFHRLIGCYECLVSNANLVGKVKTASIASKQLSCSARLAA